MSDSEEDDNFQVYGTLLEAIDEDTISKKKPFSIEDQVATDDQGRRRFHGAFTGGFSAGFFNTVGSLEGWKPSEFKSSRSEKADKRKQQQPEDFMDDEDTGVFGIAPKRLKATSDYSQVSKRKRLRHSDGPIPGDPVLYSLLEAAKETVGIRLLKKMGWKPGQGVGPRITKSEKIKTRKEREKNVGKIYGCEVPEQFRKKIDSEYESSDSDSNLEINFAPDDYDAFIYKPKDNTFGMGYKGLAQLSVLNHSSLFGTSEFKMKDKNNKKISVTGQAFGVGAFENEDEDIYLKDDMSKYDFELNAPGKKTKVPKQITSDFSSVLEGFVSAKTRITPKKVFPPPEIPKGFIPKHGARISRFEPLPESHKFFKFDRSKNTGRHDLTASHRSKILNSENITITETSNIPKQKILSSVPKIDTTNTINEQEKKLLLEKAKKITEGLTQTPCGSFKPFISDEDKQKRYEIYLTLNTHNLKEKLADIQPPSMSDWEKSREKSEFDQAARLFKPTTGLIFDKFVASSSSTDDLDLSKSNTKSVFLHGTSEMRDAVKRKLFGPLTRVILPWNPHKLLCRRFNVPEPDISNNIDITSKRKNRFNIFDYYEAYQQNKGQGIPKPVENLKEEITDKKSEENDENDIISIDVESEKDQSIPSASSYKPSDTENTLILAENKIPQVNLVEDIKPKQNFEPNINVEGQTLNVNIEGQNKEEMLTVPEDPKAKKDLFKAIFLSSSESENESETEKDEEIKFTEMKKIVEESVTKKPEMKDEPHRFIKKGFFSDLDLSKINKPAENKLEEKTSNVDLSDKPKSDDSLYGPKLPMSLPENAKSVRHTFQKPNKSSVPLIVVPSGKEEEEWIEVDKKKKKNKHKKHKEHKEKHKKHKSKHKKRKKSDSD